MPVTSIMRKNTTDGNDLCGICHSKFEVGEIQYTHEGGRHDGFHRVCFRDWLLLNPKCPYEDAQHVDVNGLRSRMERVMTRLKPVFISAAYASTIGFAAAALGAAVAGVLGAEITGVLVAVAAEAERTETEVVAGMVALGTALTGVVVGKIAKAVASGAVLSATLARGAVAEVALRGRGAIAEGMGAAEVALAAAVVVVAAGADRSFERRGIIGVARQNIIWALVASSCIGGLLNIQSSAQAVSVISLAGGAIAGALSFFRR